MYRTIARGVPSEGHVEHAQKIWRSSAVWFSRYADGQTHIQTLSLDYTSGKKLGLKTNIRLEINHSVYLYVA